jgi:hypothetical protein
MHGTTTYSSEYTEQASITQRAGDQLIWLIDEYPLAIGLLPRDLIAMALPRPRS